MPGPALPVTAAEGDTPAGGGHPTGGCASCASGAGGDRPALQRMGIAHRGHDHVVALAGNPNTGKSTVFNALTGMRQHVGNWPGKTVARAEGAFRFGEHRYKVVDLPGTQSLRSNSEDEEVARDFLLFGAPDVTVAVVDATRLQRNLALVLQIREITDRVVVALNLMDEAQRHGITIDVRHLSRELGVPVVPVSARKGEGIAELLTSVDDMVQGRVATRSGGVGSFDSDLEHSVATLARQLDAQFGPLPNVRWLALRLLEGDRSIEQAVREGTLGSLAAPERARMAGQRE